MKDSNKTPYISGSVKERKSLYLAEIGNLGITSCFVGEGDKSGLRNFQLKTVEQANNDVQQAVGNEQLELCSKVREQNCRSGSHLHEAIRSGCILDGENWIKTNCVWEGGYVRKEVCGIVGRKRHSKRRPQRDKCRISIQRQPKSQDNIKEVRREKILIIIQCDQLCQMPQRFWK